MKTFNTQTNELLGSAQKAIELTQTGAIDFVVAGTANLETFASVYEIFSMPYLFDSEDVYKTVQHISSLPINGVKLQLLHVLKHTDLAAYYGQSGFHILSEDEYIDLVIRCLEVLSPDITIHRLTGDGPSDLLIAPLWSLKKRSVLNHIHHELKVRDTWQGRLFTE